MAHSGVVDVWDTPTLEHVLTVHQDGVDDTEDRMYTQQGLSDRFEIADLLTRYTVAIDRGEWDRLDTVFTGDARIDYTATGGIAGSFAEVKDWLARTLPMFARRQHVIGQADVRLEQDAATVTAYFLNPLVLSQEDGSEQVWEFGGYYHHRLVRTDAGWRSRELVEELAWKRGVPL
jgi:SnoaL-like domain